MFKSHWLVALMFIGMCIIALLLFTIPIYKTSVDLECGLKKGIIRKSLIHGDSKNSIEREIENAAKLNQTADCATSNGNTTYKLYVL